MRRLSLIILALTSAPVAAQNLDRTVANQSAGSAGGSIKWNLELAPVLVGRVPFRESDRVTDDNSATLSLTVQQPLNSGLVTKISPAISYSRNFLGDAEDSSAFSTTFRVEKDDHLVFGNPAAEATLPPAQQDVITPFASYKVELGFLDILHGRSYVDHVFSAGVTFKNVLYVMCKEGENPARRGCTGGAGLAYSVTPAVEYSISDKDTRERLTPKLTANLTYPTRRLSFSLKGIAEARFFDDLRTPTGRRRDYRFTLAAGVNLAKLLQGSDPNPWLQELSIGGRIVRNSSNADGEDFTKWQILPVITFGTRL